MNADMVLHEGIQEAPRYCEYRGASCCVGLVLTVHKELFVKPLADIVRNDTCCDGQCERSDR